MNNSEIGKKGFRKDGREEYWGNGTGSGSQVPGCESSNSIGIIHPDSGIRRRNHLSILPFFDFSSFFTILFLLLGFSAPLASAQNAYEIVKKADQKVRGETSKATMTMKIERPTWSRTVSLKFWSKGTDYSMILVTDPARDRGTAFLKRKTEIWNWVPSISRVVKLPPSMMMQSWMGSDFKNDDLVKESSMVTDYTHALVGDSTISGYKCYEIKMIPKPNAAVVWGKVLVWIAQKEFMELKVKFFDEDGNLVNTMNASDIKILGGRKLPAQMEMIPSDKPGNKTILIYHQLTFNQPIPLSFFSTQNMKRLQ